MIYQYCNTHSLQYMVTHELPHWRMTVPGGTHGDNPFKLIFMIPLSAAHPSAPTRPDGEGGSAGPQGAGLLPRNPGLCSR